MWLTAIVLSSTVFRWWIGRGMPGPFIFVDELIYAELARSIADGDGLQVRDQASGFVSVVYPLLIAPAYVLFDSLPDAHAGVKAINAVLMSLAAVPAYFLARRVLAPGLSLLAALLAVALPSFAYTGTVMTENAFYPAFLGVALALVLALERPTFQRQLVLLAVCGVAVLIRVQGIALVLAAVSAPLLLWLFARRPLRPWRVLYAVLIGAGALAVVLQLVRGASLSSLLGVYAVVGETGYDSVEVARYLVWHLAELDLYLGVFPLAALVLLLAHVRALDPQAQAFLAAVCALGFWVLLVVAAFASKFASNRIQERNMFFLVPLFLIALLVWVDRGTVFAAQDRNPRKRIPIAQRSLKSRFAPRPRIVAVAAALGAGALPALIPYERFIETGAISDTLMLLPLWNLQDRITLPRVDEVVLLAGLIAAVVFLLLPRRWALALPLAVLLYFALAFRPVTIGAHGLRLASQGAVFTGIRKEHRDWIDRAVPEGSTVAILWTGRPDRFTVNQNEFFNRSVGPIYTLRGPVPGNLPETPVTVDEQGVLRRSDGSAVREEYVLTDGSVDPEGVPVARDAKLGLTLYRSHGTLISTTTVEGLYDDQWSGPEVTYRRVRCEGGTVTVTLESDPALFDEPQQVEAESRSSRETYKTFAIIPPTKRASLKVRLGSRGGVCTARFTVTPTKVPGGIDSRELGTHFRAFEYRAP